MEWLTWMNSTLNFPAAVNDFRLKQANDIAQQEDILHFLFHHGDKRALVRFEESERIKEPLMVRENNVAGFFWDIFYAVADNFHAAAPVDFRGNLVQKTVAGVIIVFFNIAELK